MHSQAILDILIHYRYWVLFPLAFFEGPIISLAVGFLIYLGYFSFLPAYCLLLLGDLVPDTMYYYIGRFGNKKNFIEKYGSRSKLISNNLPLIEKLWHDHGRKTMFFSKLAYGLSTPFLISAGLVNLSLKKFVSYALPITAIQYAVILVLGYYLGASYQAALPYIKDAGFIIAGIVFLFIVAYVLLQKYARREILKMEEEEK